ncbi:MAG TPA: hypothetical protein VKQ70_14620 [Caulobacteraceae bacterium]|nr:hypothetical protein [Caulobacteraceae bacterium]
MRSLLIVSTLLAAGAAQAATPRPAPPPAPPPAPAPPPVPPRVFQQAGYAEPEIGGAACKVVNAGETQCVAPAMTAGVYLVQASGTSTAQAADSAQQLSIVAGDQSCTSTRGPDPKTPWAVGAKRTFASGCVFTIVTDRPLALTVVYLDAKATKDPAGPTITVTREPWAGVLNSLPVTVKQP